MIPRQMLTAHSQLTTQTRLWLEQLPSAIALFDHQMHYISASHQWREILSLGDRDLRRFSYTQTCPILPVTWSAIEYHCFAGFSQSWKTEHSVNNSQRRWLQWQACPWRNEDGQVGGLTLTVEERVEETVVSLQETTEAFEQFRQLADNVPGMIYKFRLAPDGTRSFPYVSSRCEDLYELTPQQVQQQPELMFEVVHPDDLPLVETALAKSAETLKTWECEWRIIPASGQEKWLKGISQPQLQPDASIVWNGCVVDISDHKEIETKLQHSQQLLQLVLDNIPHLIFWKDRNSVYQGCNQNFARVAGVDSPEDIIGKTDYDLAWTDAEANQYRQYDREVMTSGQPQFHIIETQQQADGKQAWLDTHKIPLRDSQAQVIGILGTIEEITERKQAEETLKQYNEELETQVTERTTQLQQSLKQLKDLKFTLDQFAIISITDTCGNIIEVNDQFCKISGYSREELIGKNQRIINSGYHSQAFFQQMWCTISGGKMWQGEIKNKAKDGSFYWVNTIILPLLNENNKPYQYISIRHNISEHKQAEIALQQNKAQLQAILDNAPAAIFLKSVEGKYIVVNRELGKLLQKSPAELLDKTDYDLFPTEIAETFRDNDQQVIEAGQAIYLEEIIQLSDGDYVYEVIKFPIYDGKGNLYATGGVAIDVTTRKTAENALKQSEARFQRLAANIPGMLYQLRLGRDGTLSFPYVSSGCRDLYGLEPKQVQQDANLLKIHPDDEIEVMAAVAFSAQTLQDWTYEWRIVLPSGKVKWVQAISRPERQADGSTLWNGCLIDISDRKRTEEQLQQFQQRLSLMVEQMPIAVVEWNTEMEVTAWNPAAEKMFGYSRQEAVGQFMDFIIPEAAREAVPRISTDLLLQPGGQYSVNENCTKEGQTILCEWYNTPLVTPEGKVIGVASHALDITERKRAEQQLQQTTIQLEEAQKLAHIGNWNYEIATGDIQWSEEVFRIHGLADKTTIPNIEQLIALYHPQDQQRLQRLITQAATLGQAYNAELRIIHPDGEIRHVSIKGEGILNHQGQVVRVFGTVMDITERKQAEITLQQTTRDLQQAQRIAHIGNWEYDAVTEALSWSEEVFRIFNRPLNQGIPALSEAIAYYDPEDIPQLQQALEQMLVTGEAVELELRVRSESENQRYVNIKAEAVQDQEGQVTRLFGTVMDITARKRAELQLQQQAETLQNTLAELRRTQAQMIQSEKMSSLGQMVAGVAHEINNPVNFIHGNLTHAYDYLEDLFELLDLYQQHYPQPVTEIQDLIEEIELDFVKTDFTKILRSMKMGTERIRSIVLSLRNFARLDEAECKRVDIHEGIDNTLMILQNCLKGQAGQPEIKVIKDYTTLPQIECYPGQLNQVFMNILDNAIDALKSIPNQKQIRVQTEKMKSDWVRIRIGNSGPAIAEHMCAKVFDPFFTTKPVGKGTGLGLSVSYQIITEQHQGQIYCQGIPDQGTEFIIEIPVRQATTSV